MAMSFEEKSTWAVLFTFLLVYGWYFTQVSAALATQDAASVEYQVTMGVTVASLIGISIVTHIILAILSPDDADKTDERDREISVRGEYIGGFVVSTTALVAIGLAMLEMPHFWIANALLLGLVAAELVTDCIKIYYYRRGF
jgi:hypothetical protein